MTNVKKTKKIRKLEKILNKIFSEKMKIYGSNIKINKLMKKKQKLLSKEV